MGWGHSARGNGSLQRIIRWGCRNIYAEFAVRINGFIGSSKIGTILLVVKKQLLIRKLVTPIASASLGDGCVSRSE
jgi:hypothetical protein